MSKIASGGELSRILLAIKTVLSGKDKVDTLIFDEVDTGISGAAANKVGQKLKQVSKTGRCCALPIWRKWLLWQTITVDRKARGGRTHLHPSAGIGF